MRTTSNGASTSPVLISGSSTVLASPFDAELAAELRDGTAGSPATLSAQISTLSGNVTRRNCSVRLSTVSVMRVRAGISSLTSNATAESSSRHSAPAER
jgi:hypothetical protein